MSQAVTQQLRTSGAYANKPLDERATVATFEQLQTNFPGAYVGLHIYVEDRQIEYVVTKLDGTDIDMEHGLVTLEEFAKSNSNSVLYTEQTLTDAQKTQARQNIGAGTSNFSGNYNDLINKPAIPDVSNKVDKVTGKGLSTNDYTDTDKTKVNNAIQTPSATENGKIPVMRDGSIEWESKPQDGEQGPQGEAGHNPCLGRFTSIPNPMPTAQIGDYLYVDITTTDPTTQEETTTTTVYHYGSNGWDNGAAIDAEHPTLASGQRVTAVHIKDENGNDASGSADVLSAEAGKNIGDAVFETDTTEQDIPLTKYSADAWKTDGTMTTGGARWTSNKVPVNEGEVYQVNVKIGNPTTIAYLSEWSGADGSTFEGCADGFEGGTAGRVDKQYVVPQGVTYIAISAVDNSTPFPSLKKITTTKETTFYSKSESDQLFQRKGSIKFETNEKVEDVSIINNPVVGGEHNVPSAESVKSLYNSIKEIVSETAVTDVTPAEQTPRGFWNASGVWESQNGRYSTQQVEVTPGDTYLITVRTGTPTTIAYLAQWNGDTWVGASSQFAGGSSTQYTDEEYVVPEGVTKIAVCNYSNASPLPAIKKRVTTTEIRTKFYSREDTRKLVNHWAGKTIWWCGTSIPAGSDQTLGSDETIAGNYPTEVGKLIGCEVINKAEGGSMCRANVRTGNYDDPTLTNLTSALTMTKAEIEYFIENYDTIRTATGNESNWPATNPWITRMRAASFEDRLLPYLDGTYPMPDLFVFNHGHNDFKTNRVYPNPDNPSTNISDLTLQPTVANINAGILAEDTYMTSNNCEKLESFMGSLDNIPSSKKADFVASLNRNCFLGAANFLFTLILHYNPHARIVIIGDDEYKNGPSPEYAPVIDAQVMLSDAWAIPLCKVYEKLGYSRKLIPGSMAWFNATYPNVSTATTDITVERAFCPDGVHPHSDTTGHANKIYAGVVAEFLGGCW